MSKETKNTGTAARSTFSSSLGFFLAAVGGAVGLGNEMCIRDRSRALSVRLLKWL